ncbi:MAG: hypothetical protein ACI857_002714 [Arenicella sp.]|jgi:hypothetical protein
MPYEKYHFNIHLMTSRLSLVCFLFSAHLSLAQMNMQTPVGFDEIYIEMNTKDLVAEMGTPKEIRSYKDEKKVWTDGDHDLSKAVVFLIGFDQVYIFDYQNKYCLWKAYVKDGKVIYINFSSTYLQDKYKNNLTVNGKIKYGDSIEKIVSVLGENFFPDRGFGYTDYLFNDLGIRFTFHQNKMTHIYLYRKLTSKANLYLLVKHYPKDYTP